MDNIIEIVTFKLLPQSSHQALIDAAKQSQSVIADLPGFQYRSTSYNAEQDMWTDVVYWDSLDDAKSAGEKFMQCEECAPLLALIDPESVNMQHQTIKMSDLAKKYQ